MFCGKENGQMQISDFIWNLWDDHLFCWLTGWYCLTVCSDNQHCRYTHAQKSLNPRSPRHAFNQNVNPLSHSHICSFWLELTLDQTETQPQCCPPPTSMPALLVPLPRSPLPIHPFFFFFWSSEAPQIHFRVGGSEDWCWQDTNTICSSSIRQSKAVPHSAGQSWASRTNLIECWSQTCRRLSKPLVLSFVIFNPPHIFSDTREADSKWRMSCVQRQMCIYQSCGGVV